MNIVGAIGYGFAAAAFMLLAVLMMISWRGRRQGVYFIAASVITAIATNPGLFTKPLTA